MFYKKSINEVKANLVVFNTLLEATMGKGDCDQTFDLFK